MSRIVVVSAVVCWLGSFATAQEAKPTVQEKAARRLAELLKVGVLGDRQASAPVPRQGPVAVENPEAALKPYQGTPPPLPLAAPAKVQPRHLPEPAPLVGFAAVPQMPATIALPVLPPVRLPSADPQTPMPLPILAKPAADRASLADPTLEASVAAALASLTPQRTESAPFTPLNLPDPFEHAEAVRLRWVLEELPTPPPLTIVTPAK